MATATEWHTHLATIALRAAGMLRTDVLANGHDLAVVCRRLLALPVGTPAALVDENLRPYVLAVRIMRATLTVPGLPLEITERAIAEALTIALA